MLTKFLKMSNLILNHNNNNKKEEYSYDEKKFKFKVISNEQLKLTSI
jgi:hypothetical protein